MGKEATHSTSVEAFEHTSLPEEKAGTAVDRRDMYRMGKTQELRRNFRFIPIFGFAAVLMITWEGVLNAVSYAIPNGGLPTMVWMYLVVFFGFGAAILTMAEMASIAPTSGGQYHWVSEFAPRSSQKLLSYLVGWFCVLGWQAGIAGQCFTVALQIQGLALLNHPGYDPKAWHAVLLTIATVLLTVLFNSLFARQLPLIEAILLVLHVCGFVAILVPLWVYGPAHTNAEVWDDFVVTSGWSLGAAVFVGMTGPLYAILGPDAAVHMAEEVQDASLILPWAMIYTLLLNGFTGFVMIVTFAYKLGSLSAATAPMYNFAFIGSFYSATGSKGGATGMSSIITTLTFFSAISNMATASRQMFAFARDGGLPFSAVWRHVRPGWDVPINAIIFSCIFTSVLTLISLGNSTAFNAILSIGIVGLLTSYLVSLSCFLLKRWRDEELPPSRFRLNKPFGYACNIVGLVFLAIAYIFAFFPLGTDPTVISMNWAIVIYGGVAVLAMIYYLLFARHIYSGPVAQVVKDM